MMSINSGDWSQLLLDKVVFITGGAGHIAKCIAKTCYDQGARVVLGDLDPILTNKIKDGIVDNQNKTDDRILVVKLDVTDEKSIQQAVQTTIDKWKTIHVLLNSAAIPIIGNVEVSAEDWSRLFDTNVRGYALMAKHIAPIMKKQNYGSIVNIDNMCIKGSCLKRVGQAQDIANLMVFVISDLCQFMTGADLIADGGSFII